MSDQKPSTAFSSDSRPMLPCQSKLTTWEQGRGGTHGAVVRTCSQAVTPAGWDKNCNRQLARWAHDAQHHVMCPVAAP